MPSIPYAFSSSSNLLSLTTKNKALAVSAGALFFYFTTSLVFVVFPIEELAGFAGLHEIVLDFWLFVTPGLFVVLGIAGDQAIGPVALFVKLEVLVGDGAFRIPSFVAAFERARARVDVVAFVAVGVFRHPLPAAVFFRSDPALSS